jgi:nucleotide-binding universal stress UspA family protein
MKLLKTILVAVDFDDALDGIMAAVGALAKKFDSEVILAHVMGVSEALRQAPESLQGLIAARLGQLQQQLTLSGVNVPQVFSLSGIAPLEIVEAAERFGASLIVLGSRSKAADHPFPLGTTTEKVIRWSSKPVLAIPPEPRLAFANIVCPVDFSDISARGLTAAIHLARAFQGKLQVLTVVAPLPGYHRLGEHKTKGAGSAEQTAEATCLRDFDEFLGRFDFQGVTWEKHILNGDPAHEIVHWAKSTHADLIVMGSVGRTGLPYLFMGSTAVKVVRQLPCALLTAKRVQLLIPDLAKKIADMNAAFAEGQAFLTQGFCQEAIARFDECLSVDPRCVNALEAKAEAYDRLRLPNQADECRKLAETTRRELWGNLVTAEVRAEHPFFHRRKPYA